METKEQLALRYYPEILEDDGWDKNLQYREPFIEGFSANKKLTDKIILDTLNKYKSSLANEQITKLGRTANFEKQVHYKACIEVLLEIQNKLSPKD